MTKRKKSFEDRFPEFEPGLEGLHGAYSVCLPNKVIPIDAYDKIWWSFQYLNKDRSDFFIPLFETDPECEKTKFSNRGFYKKSDVAEYRLDFDEYLRFIIEVLVFSQKSTSSLRKQIERHYLERNKKIVKIQEHRLTKIAELASYVMYSHSPNLATSGSAFEDYARISIRHCFEVLKAVFEEALELDLKVFNNLNNFEDTLRKHLAYFPPGCSPVFGLDMSTDLESGFITFQRIPRKLSQKPT